MEKWFAIWKMVTDTKVKQLTVVQMGKAYTIKEMEIGNRESG